MTSGRMRRVDEAIRQVIGEVVAGELKDPRVGFVTVTDVRTSADLSHARVYVSVLGDEPAREATLAGLRSAHGYMQRRVASELRLKRTPTLDFVYDDTTDRAMRLEALLDEPGAGGDEPWASGDEPGASMVKPGADADELRAGVDEPQASRDEQGASGDE
ncbi:MAG TPA: 30S ribosome-binding factor RbfA [Solirubrobacteraceae bacterium]|nr:30S ribosome-binding factor RbfA [Solirubrobacteraceae bacterium]